MTSSKWQTAKDARKAKRAADPSIIERRKQHDKDRADAERERRKDAAKAKKREAVSEQARVAIKAMGASAGGRS